MPPKWGTESSVSLRKKKNKEKKKLAPFWCLIELEFKAEILSGNYHKELQTWERRSCSAHQMHIAFKRHPAKATRFQ